VPLLLYGAIWRPRMSQIIIYDIGGRNVRDSQEGVYKMSEQCNIFRDRDTVVEHFEVFSLLYKGSFILKSGLGK